MKIKFFAVVFDDYLKNVIDENGKIKQKRYLEVMSEEDKIPVKICVDNNSKIYIRHFGYNFNAEILTKEVNGKKCYSIDII